MPDTQNRQPAQGIENQGIESQGIESQGVHPESAQWYCRVGVVGHVGRFLRSVAAGGIRRGDWVLCRTARGLEVGQVLCSSTPMVLNRRLWTEGRGSDGDLLRRMTAEDWWLHRSLQQLSREAMQACQDWLLAEDRAETLIEVEPLMDGRTLYFHFAGTVQADVQATLTRLVDVYQQRAAEHRLTHLLEHGCGPDCGTERGTGCDGGCAVCVVASACRSK